ncbi:MULTISPECIES: MarR family winged helix-turn-helix transcriptional regulator [unclassified Sedimentibacter]|uniref:MarR family winged helix-turn-helix transcriptional regulator n=1 Tax=unclassified Sedimentibacter TaxID=2649220 RepID=UPI0027E210FF|nr:helix-turn-helix domain-containing protein [Sedimentibacter sp. MB35-C1]WMJ77462.1 helix-turn-helix domain-containing protein [Sedimentibacter sp. MB35-C1]
MINGAELLLSLQTITRLFEKYGKQACDLLELNMTEMRVLMFLINNPDKDTASDIVNLFFFPKASVSITIDTLIKKGYLERLPDKNDRRRIHLNVIKDIDMLKEIFVSLKNNFFSQLYTGFTEEEINQHQKFYERIVNNAINGLNEE